MTIVGPPLCPKNIQTLSLNLSFLQQLRQWRGGNLREMITDYRNSAEEQLGGGTPILEEKLQIIQLNWEQLSGSGGSISTVSV